MTAPQLIPLIDRALDVIALALVLIFAVRPMMRWMSTLEPRPLPGREAASAGAGGLLLPEGAVRGRAYARRACARRACARHLPAAPPEEEMGPEKIERDAARRTHDEVRAFVSAHPDRAADLLREWLRDQR